MRSWARRAAWLHAELAAVAELRDPRWWLVAAGAALPWHARVPNGRPREADGDRMGDDTDGGMRTSHGVSRDDAYAGPRDHAYAGPRNHAYVASDAEPASDTFIGTPRETPADPLALARAARLAILALDGELVDQPLAITLARGPRGAVAIPSTLTVAAFARGDRVWCVRIDEPDRELAIADAPEVPFVCVSIGDEPIETARHGHRRAWRDGAGPWLGLGTTSGLAVVSTCHMVVDGYGHARLAAKISAYATDAARTGVVVRIGDELDRGARVRANGAPLPLVPGAIPLRVVWRELDARPRALELSYATGRLLHRLAGDPQARFSPTFQIPIAPGELDDPGRMKRRVVQTIASVRFERGEPEPFAAFAARTKTLLAREATGNGVSAHLMAAARGVPVPLAWKRRAIGASRPGWLDVLAGVIGGRACVSRIEVDVPLRGACAVSSPARLATSRDPLGSCVITVIDDGESAALTLCGSGECAAPDRLDELLALLPG